METDNRLIQIKKIIESDPVLLQILRTGLFDSRSAKLFYENQMVHPDTRYFKGGISEQVPNLRTDVLHEIWQLVKDL